MRNHLLSRITFICLCAGAAGYAQPAAHIIHVEDDARGVNDGSSWQNAYPRLQDALTRAKTMAGPVEIRVAQGVYKPDLGAGITPGDQKVSFQLLNGVTLKGGYAGASAPDPDACDPKQYESILSGDLKGDDVEVTDPNRFFWPLSEPTRADNSFHVVNGSGTDESTVLDGFVITASQSYLSPPAERPDRASGSAMYIDLGSPSVLHCIFRDNFSAGGGGAVHSHDSSPAFAHCTFDHNASAGGGAMYNDNSRIVLENCTFSDNSGSRGGALLNEWYSSVYLRNCIFTANESSEGGAIHNYADSSAELQNCTFERNRVTGFLGNGGAISGGATLTLTACTFRENSAAFRGGAVYVDFGTLVVSGCGFSGNTVAVTGRPSEGGAVYIQWGAIATFTDCTFEGNAASSGGAIYNDLTYAKIIGCRFTDNTAVMPPGSLLSRGGGGAITARGATMKLTDCDFQGNRAFDEGGALQATWDASLFFANCLLAGNRAERGGAIGTDYMIRSLRLNNCTLASNFAGDGFALTGSGVLEHCIVWDGSGLMPSSYRTTTASYCDIQGGFSDEGDISVDPPHVRPGMATQPRIVSHDNIDVDPLFVRPGYWADANDPNLAVEPEHPEAIWVPGEYHPQSQAGHWDRQTQAWVRDDQTSPCIDAGNPAQPFDAEPFPNGGIVNLGAYGGTAEASKSYFGGPVCETQIAGDINGDCKVDQTDMDILLSHWLMEGTSFINVPPTITLLSPQDGAELTYPEPILFQVAASDPDGTVARVWYMVEYRTETDSRRGFTAISDSAPNWDVTWDWSRIDHDGKHTVWVEAVDNEGARTVSPKITVTFHPAK